MSDGVSAAFEWRTLDALSWDEAANAFNLCYEGYVIPVRAGAADLASRCLAEDVDPSASHVVSDASGPVAIGLIARRGGASRLAAFAVVPRARGQGVARPFLAPLRDESRRRGDTTLELEVFEHNLPAVRLYAGSGFARIDRLIGFELSATDGGSGGALTAYSADELAGHLAAENDESLPWQLRARTIARIGAPWQVVGAGGAFAMVDLSRQDAVSLRLMFTLPSLRSTGRARRLLAAIRGRAAGRPIRVPQLIPERHAPFAHALGFVPAEHGQLRMMHSSASAPASAME